MLERKRGEILAAAGHETAWPSAEDLLQHVLLPIEAKLPSLGGLDEVDYLSFYKQSWRDAGYELPDGLAYAVLDEEQLCWDAAVTPAAGMFHVLHSLRAAGVRTAICSNAPFPAEMMRRQVASLGLDRCLDAVVFSSEVGRRKPAPEPYLATLKALRVPPAAALFVGDRVVEDYDGPRRLGMRAVICTGLARDEIPPGIPTIADLSQLEAWL
jgi:HAD superfamily hydrolase (TIGR01509 family)